MKLVRCGWPVLTLTAWLTFSNVGAQNDPDNANLAQLLDLPLDKLSELVVTGTTSGKGMLKQEASYPITTVQEQAILDMQTSNAAELTRLVPGLWAETSGGVAGPNVDVRGFPTSGDTPWVSVQIDGLPIFPVPTLSWMDNFSPFRLDLATQRMEATLSGPAVLWGSGQPGATVNFIQKNGLDNPGGVLRATTGTGNLERIDGYYGASLGEQWYASVGGFYRQDQGVRDTGYPADQGGQLSATLLKLIDDGRIMLYGRITNDKNAFFTDIPLTMGSTGTLSGYPGFNPLTATLYGNNTRFVTFDNAPGASQTLDMAHGRGIDSHLLGLDIDKNFGDFQFSDKMSYTSGTALTERQESGPLPLTLAQFITNTINTANSNTQVLNAAGGILATGASARYAGTGQLISNLNQEVIATNVGVIDKQFLAYQNEARLSVPVNPDNRLTFGLYFASYGDRDSYATGAYQLMQLQNNPQVINLQLNNGVQATNSDGIFSPVTNARYSDMHAVNLAGIVADEWQVDENLRLDLGYRLEHLRTDGWSQNQVKGFIGSNDLDLYDYGATYRGTGQTDYSYAGTAHAVSAGAGYKFRDDLNGFVRINEGYQFPNFDDVYNNQNVITHVQQIQVGVKQVSELASLYVTGFYGQFTGKPQQQTLSDGTVLEYLLSADTSGLELEGLLRPSAHWELSLLGDYMHGVLTAGGPGITGNTVEQQPTLQGRFTPSYLIPTEIAQIKLYGSLSYVGQRWSDLQNLQRLPPYHVVDIGVLAELHNGFSLQLTGSNVTNTLAITEGNPRVLGSGVNASNVFLGRPLFGAIYQLSVTRRF